MKYINTIIAGAILATIASCTGSEKIQKVKTSDLQPLPFAVIKQNSSNVAFIKGKQYWSGPDSMALLSGSTLIIIRPWTLGTCVDYDKYDQLHISFRNNSQLVYLTYSYDTLGRDNLYKMNIPPNVSFLYGGYTTKVSYGTGSPLFYYPKDFGATKGNSNGSVIIEPGSKASGTKVRQ